GHFFDRGSRGFHGWGECRSSGITFSCTRSLTTRFQVRPAFLKFRRSARFRPRDVQVTDHLRRMTVGERGYDLSIQNHEVVDNHILDEIADNLAAIEYWKRALQGDGVTAPP